jgi:uncharacterized membrane protein YdbT with pleckstrin-like domain
MFANTRLLFFLGTPVTASTFNWAPVMFVVAVLWSIAYYIVKGRKVYVGPVASVKLMAVGGGGGA